MLRGFFSKLLFFIDFWHVDIYQLIGGRLERIDELLVRKSRSYFEYEDGVYDIAYSARFAVEVGGRDVLSYLWQGSGGGLTAFPPGVPQYLEQMVKDREAVRNSPEVDDPDNPGRKLRLPSLDYVIVHRLLRREHVEGWFGTHRIKALQRLVLILVIGVVIMAGIAAYGFSQEKVVCYTVGEVGGQPTVVPCPVITSTTTTTTTAISGNPPGQIGGHG